MESVTLRESVTHDDGDGDGDDHDHDNNLSLWHEVGRTFRHEKAHTEEGDVAPSEDRGEGLWRNLKWKQANFLVNISMKMYIVNEKGDFEDEHLNSVTTTGISISIRLTCQGRQKARSWQV